MYEIIYRNDRKIFKKGEETFSEEQLEKYKQYLIDVENGVEVIDNKPSDIEILEIEKKNKIKQVDSKTKSLINSSTFEYDSKTFSGSYSAKNIWTDYLLGVDSGTILLPLEKATVDNKTYIITSIDQIKGALQAMFATHYAIAQPTIEMKDQINNCSSLEVLAQFEDDR